MIKNYYYGFVKGYKAHLFIKKNYTYEYGIDYEGTFTDVARLIFVQNFLVDISLKNLPYFSNGC